MSKPNESTPNDFIPIGIDLGSLHARIAIGHSTGDVDIISNAQGARYTLALVGTDAAEAAEHGTPPRHIFGETARRALARDKKPTIAQDPSSTVRALVRSGSSGAAATDDGAAGEPASAAAAFVAHLLEQACDASAAHPARLRTVVSVPVGATPAEQRATVAAVERGHAAARAARDTAQETKARKKKGGGGAEDPAVLAILTDPAAVCIAHGLADAAHSGIVDLGPATGDAPAAWKHALVINWGASGLTATHVCRTSPQSSLLSVVRSVTDAECSGTAIVGALAKHCAAMFERKTRVTGVLENKKACHRLDMACESAVRTLSRAPTVTVAVDGLFEGLDLHVPVSRPRFDMLVGGLLRRADALLRAFAAAAAVEFDVVLLAGGACDMPAAAALIRQRLFPAAGAGRGDVPPDEAVALGCARHAAAVLSCATHAARGGPRRDDGPCEGPATRTVKTCPVTIGICRIEHGKENGNLEDAVAAAVPVIDAGDALPAHVTRSITCTDGDDAWLSDSSIAIVQMQGGAVAKSKVIGKIEGIPLEDNSFEITMELSSAGKLALSVNGGKLVTL